MDVHDIILLVLVQHVGSVISQNVRLIPGPDKGRLEVKHNGSWGTVCYSVFKNKAAFVVCPSLNQPSKNAYWVTGQKFGRGSLNPRLSVVTCSGKETSIFDCRLTAASASSGYCSSSSIVGIVCTNEALKAFFKYGTPFIGSASTIDVFERTSISCYPGNDTYARDFIMSIEQDNRLLSRRNGYAYYSLTRSQEGPLSCSVSNWQMPNQDKLTVDVNVMFPPNMFVRSEITVFEGTSVNVTLTNQPNPLPYQTTWRKTGTRLKWDQTEVYRMYKSISRTDAGEFLVNISNQMNSSALTVKQGNGLELIYVDVLYKPTMQCDQEYVVVEGSKVNITCEVDANPLPHVYIWTNSSGVTISEGSKPSLIIASVGHENTGRYKCTAVNQMQDSTGNTQSGVAVTEMTIAIGSGDGNNRVESDKASSSLSVVTYSMIAVAAVSLVAVVFLVVVIIKLRNRKAKPETPSHRNTTGSSARGLEYQNNAFTESDYTALDFPDGKSK